MYDHLAQIPAYLLSTFEIVLLVLGTAMKKCQVQKLCPMECVQDKYFVRSYAHDIRHDTVTDRALKLPGWTIERNETEDYIK